MADIERQRLMNVIQEIAGFYQLIPLEDAWNVLHSLMPEISRSDFEQAARAEKNEYHYGVFDGNLCHESVLQFDDDYRELSTAIQGRPLRPATEDDFRENKPFGREEQNMADFLAAAFQLPVYTAKDMAREITHTMRISMSCGEACASSLSTIAFRGGHLLNDEQYEHFLPLYAELYNATRLPALRGFTPNESGEAVTPEDVRGERPDPQKMMKLRAQIQTMRKQLGIVLPAKNKTGRNDPCPCGSGKKYKHCCGKKE